MSETNNTQESETNTQESETNTQASEASTQASEASTQASEANTQASEASTQASEASTQASEASEPKVYRSIRQRLDIRPRRTGRTVVISKSDVEKLGIEVEKLKNVVNHIFSPTGTLFVEFQDVKNSGEFFSKINAQCKKDNLGRHTVKSSLYSAYVGMVNKDLQDNAIQDTVKLVRNGVTKELSNSNILMVNWIRKRNYGKLFLDRKADLDNLVDKGKIYLDDNQSDDAPYLTFKYWKNNRSRDNQSRDYQSRDYQSRDYQSRDNRSRDYQSRDNRSRDNRSRDNRSRDNTTEV